jgi:hypothetical protein
MTILIAIDSSGVSTLLVQQLTIATQVMVYLKFVLNDKRPKEDNIYPIVIRVTYNRNNTSISTGLRVKIDALFYGADLDITCCKMALLNMLLNSLTGEIAHMNSLSNEFFRGYNVQTTLVDNHHIPFYIEFLEPELSHIWLHPLFSYESKQTQVKEFNPVKALQPINGVQGTLF